MARTLPPSYNLKKILEEPTNETPHNASLIAFYDTLEDAPPAYEFGTGIIQLSDGSIHICNGFSYYLLLDGGLIPFLDIPVDGDTYRFRITNSGGTTISNEAILTVNRVLESYVDIPVNGDRYRFSITNSAGTTISNEAILTVTTSGGVYIDTPVNGDIYRFVVTNSVGTTISNQATLTVNSPSYTDVPVNGGTYRFKITNSVGTTTSNEAILTVTTGSIATPLAAFQVFSNGIWTWFTKPQAFIRNGFLYSMAVTAGGTCYIHKTNLSNQTTQSVQLSTALLEPDDHDNGSPFVLPDGRIVAFYGRHNDNFHRYKVSTNPEDITTWSAEQAIGTGGGPYSYPQITPLSQDTSKNYLFFRRWTSGGGTERALSVRTTTNLGTIPGTWTGSNDIYLSANHIPYWQLEPDGVNKIHAFVTDMHPIEGQSSLYHFYMQLDGSNVMKYYKSDGTLISGAPPVTPATSTKVYDGSVTKCWVSDSAIDSTGAPCVLFMKYPGNDGSAIEYWHGRWNGTAWVNSFICNDGAGLYSPEVYYHGGLAFDSMDANKIFLSAPISGVRQIQEWATSNSGATWTKVRDITSGGAASFEKLRPYSPLNHDSSVRVLWVEGMYNSYTDYLTAIKAAG